LTGIAALFFSVRVAWLAYGRRVRLESYLKEVRQKARARDHQGALTDIRLGAELGMTTAQVHEAAFLSRRIKTLVVFDPETHRANGMMFHYRD
jgi:hypothetical protein